MRSHSSRLLVLLPALLALAACAPTGPEDDAQEQEQAIVDAQQAADTAATPAADTAATPPPAPSCDASTVQGLIGKAADEATVEQARTDTGAASARVLKPGYMVTMEFDGTRLNIEVDDANGIVSLRCG